VIDPPEVAASFQCSVCDAAAGEIRVIVGPGVRRGTGAHDQLVADLDVITAQGGAAVPAARVTVHSFLGTRAFPISGDDRVAELVAAVTAGDALALHELGHSCAPFCCPECSAVYCGAHWKTKRFEDDKFGLEGIEGYCPNGHFHILDY
jgi:hypothetical protein